MEQQQHIDSLLERYLSLLDEYTRLRADLSRLQSGVYHNIARANFTGERGMRYGQDHYDERMRATRVLRIEVGEEEFVPRISIKNLMDSAASEGAKEDAEPGSSADGGDADTTATAQDHSEATHDADQPPEAQDENKEKQQTGKKPKTKRTSRNPLHWYGLLAPLPLRTAQALSVEAVEQVIPRLVSVNAEMEHVEIEIRRARKKRAKAAAVADKEALGVEVEAR